GSDAARAAAAPSPDGGRCPGVWLAPPAGARAHAPARRVGRVRRRLLGMACPRPLRSGAALRLLAPRPACLLLRHRLALLATGDFAMAGAVALAAVGDDPVSRARRAPEQRAGRDPH